MLADKSVEEQVDTMIAYAKGRYFPKDYCA